MGARDAQGAATGAAATLDLLDRAYSTAEHLHRGVLRKSGEPYITHPLAVAQILADLGLGPKAIAAAHTEEDFK